MCSTKIHIDMHTEVFCGCRGCLAPKNLIIFNVSIKSEYYVLDLPISNIRQNTFQKKKKNVSCRHTISCVHLWPRAGHTAQGHVLQSVRLERLGTEPVEGTAKTLGYCLCITSVNSLPFLLNQMEFPYFN